MSWESPLHLDLRRGYTKMALLYLTIFSLLWTAVFGAPSVQNYRWSNVRTGTGGGFISGIVFNQGKKGVAYARTDIGGAYRLNSDDTWTPLLDWVNSTNWDFWYVDALATDAIDASSLYLLVGAYTNSWDPNNAHILRSTDQGQNFQQIPLPFKAGGNMHGRGLGERLQVDPNLNNILFLGARDGHGLWKSVDHGVTWSNVTSFKNTGTYIENPSDTSGISNDITGITWITFDKTSSNSGQATKRIFVGLADPNNSVWVTEDGGATCENSRLCSQTIGGVGVKRSAIPGQLTGFIPHKGKLDLKAKIIYVSYTEGDGPNDGVSGHLYRLNITSGVWTDISPPTGTYGYGGLDVDAQNSGTLMVAALNDWWPDTLIWRSNDFGATWSPIWDWGAYPDINFYYDYDVSSAPWLATGFNVTQFNKQVGWWIEALVIDPFDRNHFLYGTGETIYGSKDLLNWDTKHNITLSSLGYGIEETAVQKLISPSSGAHLLTGVGDVGGWLHTDLNTPPANSYLNPMYATVLDLDWAGNAPNNIVRIGNDGSGTVQQVAVSTDGGATWNPDTKVPISSNSGNIALSANGTTTLWVQGSGSAIVSINGAAYVSVSGLPSGATVTSDKKNNAYFYAASGSTIYVSSNSGATFTTSTTVPSTINAIEMNPSTAGYVVLATASGLYKSTDFGKTFQSIGAISSAYRVSVGAAPAAGKPNSVFVSGVIGGKEGYFRTDDNGATWVQVNNASYGFGTVSSNPMVADPRVYGRLYVGTNGRGTFYGDIS